MKAEDSTRAQVGSSLGGPISRHGIAERSTVTAAAIRLRLRS